jgi:hypothetical protein
LALRDVTCHRKLATGSFAQQRVERAAQQLAEGMSDGPPVITVAGVEPPKTNQEIKRFTVHFDEITCSPTSLPRPPAPGVVCTPLPDSGRFLKSIMHACNVVTTKKR